MMKNEMSVLPVLIVPSVDLFITLVSSSAFLCLMVPFLCPYICGKNRCHILHMFSSNLMVRMNIIRPI